MRGNIYRYILNKKYIISLSLLQNAHYNLRVSGLDINSKKEKKRLNDKYNFFSLMVTVTSTF